MFKRQPTVSDYVPSDRWWLVINVILYLCEIIAIPGILALGFVWWVITP